MLLGRGDWDRAAIDRPHLTSLAKRIAEAIKSPKVRDAIREGSLQWAEETHQATALHTQQGFEPATVYPVPLPDMASETVMCAALAAIHDHFPTNQKLGPQNDPEHPGGNVHEHFADCYAFGYYEGQGYIRRGYGEGDARRLSDYLEELVVRYGKCRLLDVETSAPEVDQVAIRQLLSTLSDGVSDQRISQALALLKDANLTVSGKLNGLGVLFPLLERAPAQKLSDLIKCSKTAVINSDWWRENRRGEREEVANKRLDLHQQRSREMQSPHPED